MSAIGRALATSLVTFGIAIVVLVLFVTFIPHPNTPATPTGVPQLKTESLNKIDDLTGDDAVSAVHLAALPHLGGDSPVALATPTALAPMPTSVASPSATTEIAPTPTALPFSATATSTSEWRSPAAATQPAYRSAATAVPTHRPRPSPVSPSHATPTATRIPTPVPTAIPTPVPSSGWRPITRVAIPRIGLTADVVFARMRQYGTERTWEVPPFKVGHGQYTAGAGQTGVAVLFGHVSSQFDGSVFQTLHRANVGDVVQVYSGAQRFDYRVVDKRIVLPNDLSVLDPVGPASLVVITCAGVWVPSQNDYSERLVLRAVLI